MCAVERASERFPPLQRRELLKCGWSPAQQSVAHLSSFNSLSRGMRRSRGAWAFRLFSFLKSGLSPQTVCFLLCVFVCSLFLALTGNSCFFCVCVFSHLLWTVKNEAVIKGWMDRNILCLVDPVSANTNETFPDWCQERRPVSRNQNERRYGCHSDIHRLWRRTDLVWDSHRCLMSKVVKETGGIGIMDEGRRSTHGWKDVTCSSASLVERNYTRNTIGGFVEIASHPTCWFGLSRPCLPVLFSLFRPVQMLSVKLCCEPNNRASSSLVQFLCGLQVKTINPLFVSVVCLSMWFHLSFVKKLNY